jgi:hypothetical protein
MDARVTLQIDKRLELDFYGMDYKISRPRLQAKKDPGILSKNLPIFGVRRQGRKPSRGKGGSPRAARAGALTRRDTAFSGGGDGIDYIDSKIIRQQTTKAVKLWRQA